jgi:hypothetical protein
VGDDRLDLLVLERVIGDHAGSVSAQDAEHPIACRAPIH